RFAFRVPRSALTYARRYRGSISQHLSRARALPVPQGLGRRARGGLSAGGVRTSRGTQAGEYAGLAVRRGRQHGARRGASRRARKAASDAAEKRAGCRTHRAGRGDRRRSAAIGGAGGARPAERSAPPFEQLSRSRPPKRSPWHVRTTVAWAASITLALGLGYYLRQPAAPFAIPEPERRTDHRIVALHQEGDPRDVEAK